MFVLTIADATPVLRIWIWQNCFKNELWNSYGRLWL